MAQTPLSIRLQGGDRRSIGNSNEVAASVARRPELFPELVECMSSDDALVRMRAADAAEKVTLKRPELLEPFKEELLALADETTQMELRWHLALMLPRLVLTRPERRRAMAALKRYLSDRSSIVKTCALQGLADLARSHEEFEAEVLRLLEKVGRTGTPAMKARSRKLMTRLTK